MDIPLHASLEGQVALVSGGTRGIGARIVQQLADHGATVFAGARDPAVLEDVQHESDGRIQAVQLDVCDESSMRHAVEHVQRVGGRLDILVNNAGVGDWRGSNLIDLEAKKLDNVLATNLRGPMLLTGRALPHLLKRPGGRVVNVSSGMGALGEGMSGSAPAYRVSKTGLNGLTVYLHGEYNGQGLIANCVCPGWVRTDMGGANASREPDKGAETPVWLSRFQVGGPSGHFWRDRQIIDW